jgi:hypothetical protein
MIDKIADFGPYKYNFDSITPIYPHSNRSKRYLIQAFQELALTKGWFGEGAKYFICNLS